MVEEWWRSFFDEWYLRTYPHDEQATVAQVDFVVEALGLRHGASVLDLCCGYGRHSVVLAERGFRVSAFDLSPVLLKRAREVAAERGVPVAFHEGDMRTLPFQDGAFDGCINLFTAFGYFDDPADNERVLSEVARVLRPGGAFLIDAINRDYLVKSFHARSWDEVGGVLVLHRHHWEAATGQLVEERSILAPDQRRERVTRLHVYTAAHLTRLIEQAGMAVRRLYGDLRGNPFDLESHRLVILAERAW